MNGIEMFAKLTGKSIEEAEAIAKAAKEEQGKRHREGRFEVWMGDTLLDVFYTEGAAKGYMNDRIRGELSECAYLHSEEIEKMIPKQYTIKDRQGDSK